MRLARTRYLCDPQFHRVQKRPRHSMLYEHDGSRFIFWTRRDAVCAFTAETSNPERLSSCIEDLVWSARDGSREEEIASQCHELL
jgi:peptide subunit release factor 1 (eRF1)